ncbi:hypothetical protein [Flavobacterium koreense]
MKTLNYKIILFLIISFYCLILSQYGMETWDTGYMSSFAWRIVNGQHVYEDFIYKFPPVTIYAHAFFMKILPETGQFFYFRIIAYLSFLLQVYFFVSGTYLIYNIKKVNKWGLIILCFLISWLNFPPYPWPTTDGLLYASIAFWIVAKNTKVNFVTLFLIAFFSLLSALSKQSFYLIPLLILVWIYLRYNLKASLYYIISLSILIGIFVLLIWQITTWQNFKQQLNGTLDLRDLYIVGFHHYVFMPFKFFVALTIIISTSLFIYLKKTNQKIGQLTPYLKKIAIAFLLVAIFLFLINKFFAASFLAFDAAVIALLYSYFEKKKTISYLFPLVVLIAISWSVSISLGYQTTLLFATGIILTFITLFENEVSINPKKYILIGLPLCLVAFAANKNPYHEDSILELNYSLESISPKLKYIKTKKETFEKHLELKQLIKKYGENYIVAPSMPMANYLFNTQSQLPGDWLLDHEIDGQNERFIKICSNKKNYIFIEKSFVTGEDFKESTIKASPTAWYIYKKFNKIDTTKYFIVYNSIKPNEKLP